MQISQQFKHSLIKKAIKLYQYDDIVNQCDASIEFYENYNYLTKGKHLKTNASFLHVALSEAPSCHQIPARNLMFQGNEECWKYFDRSAQYLAFSYEGGSLPFIDPIAPALNFALYMERTDLIQLLLAKATSDLSKDEYKNNKDYINQKVYPSTYLIHILIENYGISNPVKEKIFQYGDGLGVYEQIVSDWNSNFKEIECDYWNSLCEYHLNGIGVTGTKRSDEEFLEFGLIPMELINIFKVRQKLGLDVPMIKHELFATRMAAPPQIPTGYNPELDVKFQLIERTKKDVRRYTYDDVVELLQQEHGKEIEVFY